MEALSGKLALITGANTGLGLQTAKELSKMGISIIIACRSKEKATVAIQEIKKYSGNDKVEAMSLDLASLSSVRQFAADFKSRNQPIDILINNAGLMSDHYIKTKDGFETNFGVNHLGHFLLTLLLLDEVKKSKGRIVNVSSDLHKKGKINWDDLNSEKKWNGMFAVYGMSKLMNVLFTNELQKRLHGTGVECFSLEPGFVATDFGSNFPAYKRFFFKPVQKLFGRTVQKGAETIVFAASSPTLTGKGGSYLKDCKIITPSKSALSEEDAARLWTVSEKLVSWKAEDI